MNLKLIMALVIILFEILNISAQTENDNLEKYWTYRDRLHKNFLRVGLDKGESIPMAAKRVGWHFCPARR